MLTGVVLELFLRFRRRVVAIGQICEIPAHCYTLSAMRRDLAVYIGVVRPLRQVWVDQLPYGSGLPSSSWSAW